MNKELYDREIETKEIAKYITTETDCSKVILLSGISGVGKSGLVEKLEQTNLLARPIIFVKISKSSVDTIENLQYFNAIYRTITEHAKEKIFDNVLTPIQQGAMSPKNIFKVFFSALKSKIGVNDALALAEPSEDESVIRKKDYLLYVLKKNNIILDIENIQNIDTQSFELLKEIIRRSSSTIFILEYTLTDNHPEHYQNFYKELAETDADIYGYNVEKMNFCFAKNLAPKNVKYNEKELEALYDKSNGNLMEIILANEQTTLSLSNIYNTINQLTKNQRYILYIIFLNDSIISYDDLFSLVVVESKTIGSNRIHITYEEYEDILNQLYEKKLLIKYEKKIKIKHDSIIRELNRHTYNPIIACAYAVLKNYYTEKLIGNNENGEVVEKLLSLYLRFSDPELLAILPNIKELILNSKYPQLIIKKLDYFREQLKNTAHFGFQATYSLTIMLVEICLSKKMAEEAQKNLDLIYDETNYYHIALQAQIYSMQETMEAHENLCELIANIPNNDRLQLTVGICFLYLKTKLLVTTEAKKYGKYLLENKSYEKYPEYAFLLRNYAELCDDSEECFRLYYDALERFSKDNKYHDMASVELSLCMLHAYKGELKLARRSIEKAMKLDKRELSLCYVLNNISVIELLEGSYSDITEKKLLNSMLLGVSKYEKIIISCNLLIYYSLTNKFNQAEAEAAKIENSNYQNFKYEELLHIVYQNLYFYYTVFNHNQNKKVYYYNQILNLIATPGVREATKLLASGMNNLISNDYFFSKFPYRADFLGYWEFIVDNDLAHLQ